MTCDWDERKNALNIQRRKISFKVACQALQDPNLFLILDDRDYGDEERWMAIAQVNSILLVVVWTERDGRDRIISARKAEPHEEARYYDRF
jgi:uncharacterized DUF497 family protein